MGRGRHTAFQSNLALAVDQAAAECDSALHRSRRRAWEEHASASPKLSSCAHSVGPRYDAQPCRHVTQSRARRR
eukprot:2274813-Prymnesium_polylepis.2